ncbi:MAG TPA: hypothetical protein VGF67_28635, partial [Ktedonobacteraceae bacterium]
MLTEDVNQEDTRWFRFLQTWYETTEKSSSVKDLFALLEVDETLRDALPDRLAKYYAHEDPHRRNARSFGDALAKHQDTPFGAENVKLVKGPRDSHQKLDTWQVIASPVPST